MAEPERGALLNKASGSAPPVRLTSFAQGCPERSRRTLTIGTERSRSARNYSRIKYTLAILDTAYLLALLLIFAGFGISKILTERLENFNSSYYLVVPLYLLIASFVYYLLDFPLNFYSSYILEHKFCLSKQKIMDWLKDQVKGGVIYYIITVILIGSFYWILGNFIDNWWWVVSAVWIFFSLILARLTPVVSIPLFFKYKKLSNEELRSRIMSLADKMKVKILDVFEIDFSKKTLKANAAFVGVGKTKRVILADTLKDKYTNEEIEVILAHEFAHYKLKHLLKLILVNSLATITAFYFIFKTSPAALSFFGFSSLSEVAALPMVIMYFVVFGIVTQPFQNYISRCLERNADKTALSVTGLKADFISMMEKLSAQNLADRNPHLIIKFLFFDHPPIDERIAMAKYYSEEA